MQLKERINLIKLDKMIVFAFFISLSLALLYAVHLILIEKTIKTFVVFSYFFLLAIGVLFFRRKALYYITNVFAILLVFFNDTSNYTSIWLITLCGHITHKHLPTWLCVYVITTTISFTLQQSEVIHFIIHLLVCFLFLVIHHFLCCNKKSQKLVLTIDEKRILDELAKGKQQKEITFYCPNTVTAKIKNAKERNNIKDSHDLVRLYKLDNENNVAINCD